MKTCLSKEREERQSLEMCKQGAECLGDSNHYKSILQRISGTNESQSERFSFSKFVLRRLVSLVFVFRSILVSVLSFSIVAWFTWLRAYRPSAAWRFMFNKSVSKFVQNCVSKRCFSFRCCCHSCCCYCYSCCCYSFFLYIIDVFF